MLCAFVGVWVVFFVVIFALVAEIFVAVATTFRFSDDNNDDLQVEDEPQQSVSMK